MTAQAVDLDEEAAVALEVARGLAKAGAPIFVADPTLDAAGRWIPDGGHQGTGYWLPTRWQKTVADPVALNRWRPGMAVCMVTGVVLDGVDVDPRHGGDKSAAVMQAAGAWPRSLGRQSTPSGGWHDLVNCLGVRSRDGGLPGIDVKAGHKGVGHGFLFLAPTVKLSRATGEIGCYRWEIPPMLDEMDPDDDSGQVLAERIAKLRAAEDTEDTEDPPHEAWDAMDEATRGRVSRWLAGVVRRTGDDLVEVAQWPIGYRDEPHKRGWQKVVADVCNRFGRLARADWNDWTYAIAYQRLCTVVPSSMDAAVGLKTNWEAQRGRRSPTHYPATLATQDTVDAWLAGLAQATPDGDTTPGPDRRPTTQYFDRVDGLLAATLARDIVAVGPLAEGIDDVMWAYRDGVWRPDRHVVRSRAAELLGERYRRSHGANAEDVVRARVAVITCDPINEVINFRNGLYLWQADLLQPHSPDVRSTVQLSVDWDPDATCPEFDDWLGQVVPADLVALIWELIGYLLYSGNPLHKAIMLTGGGRNGKGTFLRVVNALLGEANVTSVSLHDLVSTRFSTASLFGRIANIAGDIDGTYLESTATFKAITGQDQISAEHKGRDRFDFTPWAVPVFSANKIPPSADTTVGYLSRWVVVPFPNDFTGREDRTLDTRLHSKDNLAGIAAKAMPALRRLMTRGEFELPQSGKDAKEEFARRVDQVRAWVDECTSIDPSYPFVARTALYDAYKAWADRDGHRPVRAGEFYDRLATVPGCTEHRTPEVGTRGFEGINITDLARQFYR
jgi:putative DNA primase/helicase